MEEKWHTIKGYHVLTYGSYIEYVEGDKGKKLYLYRKNTWGDWVQDRYCTLDAFRHRVSSGTVRLEEDGFGS